MWFDKSLYSSSYIRLTMKTSISLIGMAGAGKSSIGEELAKSLNLKFVDSDLVIEQKYGKSLQGYNRFMVYHF